MRFINIFSRFRVSLRPNLSKKIVPLHENLFKVQNIELRKKMKQYLLACLAALLAGCSTMPKVVTSDVTQSLPAKSPGHVLIYESKDTVPGGAMLIGTVKVTGGVATPTSKCMYGNMLSLAVKKTAEMGGNVLRIDEHKFPDMRSTCHRIWGTMFLVPDSLARYDTMESIQRLEEKKDWEYEERGNVKYVPRHVSESESVDVFKVNSGVSIITSEFVTPNYVYKSKSGFMMNAAYHHLWESGAGIGFNFYYYNTSFDNEIKIKTYCFGPSFVYGTRFGENDEWTFDLSMGLGYGKYVEYYEDMKGAEGNITFFGSTGVEYRFSDHVGLGLQLNYNLLHLNRPSGYDTSKYNFYGIKRFDICGGLRIYL